jgi:hypothetical protein
MDFILGLLTAVVFFIGLTATYTVGYKRGKKGTAPLTQDEVKQREIEAFNKGFKELFAYDVDKALQRKKVE